MFFILRIRR